MKQNRKWKIPHTVLERRALCFSSYKNHKLKVKLWWVGARERKWGHFLYRFCTMYRLFYPKEIFFNICVLSQCIVYYIHFQNIHTFVYQKHYFIHFCCVFLNSSKAFIISIRKKWIVHFFFTLDESLLEINHSLILCSLLITFRNKAITAWKVTKYGVISGSYFPVFWTEYRKIGTRNNSVFGHFLRSD